MKLGKLPDRTPVKMSVVLTPGLAQRLREYADFYAETRYDQYCTPYRAPIPHRPCADERSLPRSGSCGVPGRASSRTATE
ncbi:DUF2274 domain-containing protein [Bradyrhizobium sp. 482_C4_N1_1]|uniref:DUF2274 domain-containing protein n=1 Tax=unclassified Bradyrhizobium TaxID=2631580 RepID=UPI003F8A7B37